MCQKKLEMQIFSHIVVDLCKNDFLSPYLERQIPEEADARVSCAVRIATDAHQGAEDPAFDDYCAEHGLPVTTIACPAVIGTNMNGQPRRIAAGIYRGTFVHIRDNGARMSVIHATDVARAVSRVAGTEGTFTLHDGCDPTIHDVAEALAFRMAEKRIITLKPRWARLWYGSDYYNILTSNHLLENSFVEAFPDFHPVDTLNYLRTHVYDESSL